MNKIVQSVEEVFSQLSPDDEKTLISLPYRIGLFVSFADITGGWDAQDQELQSLTGILREFSEDFYKTEFAQKVLMECLHDRGQWPVWSKNIEQVPEESGRIIRLLAPMFPDKDLNDFKEVLIDIALAVAMAFREDENDGRDAAEHGGGVRGILSRLTGAYKHADPLEHINVSANEKAAILRLIQSLQYARLQRP